MSAIYKTFFIAIFLLACISFSCNELINEMPPMVVPQVIDVGIDYTTINWNDAGKQYTYSIALFRDSIVATTTGIPDTVFKEIVETSFTIDKLTSANNYWFRVNVDAGDNKPSSTSSLVGFTTK